MTITIRFDVHAERVGTKRNFSQDLDVVVESRDDVLPALHEALGEWLVFAAPSAAGQHMQLVQAHVDPCSGSFLINDGKYGHGTWTETQDPDEDQES